jgi:hypothetical protein
MDARKNTIATIFAAIGVAAVLVTGIVTSSLAVTQHVDRKIHAGPYKSWASARPRFEQNERPGGGWFAHGAVDDPPGSAFQSYGEDQSMGMVR